MSEKKKKVFISGPMSGIKDFNKPAFDKAEQWLTQAGYSVFNPARMHFDDSWTHEEIMRIDLAALAQCDYILMLDKWYYSKGAMQEYHYANAIGVERFPTQCVESPKEKQKTDQRPDKATTDKKPKISIVLEGCDKLSDRNKSYLRWMVAHINEQLSRGESLTALIDPAMDRLESMFPESFTTMAYPGYKLPSEENKTVGEALECTLLKEYSRSCSRCKYCKYSINEEPCKSCVPLIHNNWKPKEEE